MSLQAVLPVGFMWHRHSCLCRYNHLVRFHIRDFTLQDFDRLHAIDQECFPPGIAYSRRELAYYMKLKNAFTIVAEASGPGSEKSDIAGFLVGTRQKGMGHIVTIDALETYRRNGLGTLLMQSAEERFQQNGCHAVFLEVAVNNEKAIKFYKKLKYFVLKTLPRYYQDGTDAFLMAKRFETPSP